MLRNALTPDLLELLDAGSPGDLDFYSQYARHSGGPVLVLLCGTGRVAIPIARQGIPVIGLDADAGAVAHAKRKAQEAGVTRAMFVQGDPTHFVSDSKHPLVIIPGGGLQRLLTLEQQRACLLAVRSTLSFGGKLVLDLPLLEPGAPVAAESRVGRQGDQMALIRIQRRYEGARQLIDELVECHWLDQDGVVVRTQYASAQYRYATPGEVGLLLAGCGFTVTSYGGFDRQSLLPGATRLVVEAERNS